MTTHSKNLSKKVRRVIVEKIVSSRYQGSSRPTRWNYREEGVDKVVTTEGEVITLFSNGGQSTPQPGWEILLKDAPSTAEYPSLKQWTLYGIKPF